MSQHRVIGELKSLFDVFDETMTAATANSLNAFDSRLREHGVPIHAIEQLTEFYSITNGVPCLDSLDIHECDDPIIFEWWDERELWLGQRDFYVLRWSALKDRFCIGDAGSVSFSPDDEFSTFFDAVLQLINIFDSH